MKRSLFVIIIVPLLLWGCAPKNVRSIGNAKAPVKLEVFSDLECPRCAQELPKLFAAVRVNADQLYLRYRHFPLSYHPNAFAAAEAAECAGAQGKFFPFVETAFSVSSRLSLDAFNAIAETLGLDLRVFKDCMARRQGQGAVTADLKEGQKRGVAATPTLFKNGKPFTWDGTGESLINP